MTISQNLVTIICYAGLIIYLPTLVYKIVLSLVPIWSCYDKNVSAWFFWNTENFVGFSVIHVSQGSVVTYIRYGGLTTVHVYSKFPAESVSERIF